MAQHKEEVTVLEVLKKLSVRIGPISEMGVNAKSRNVTILLRMAPWVLRHKADEVGTIRRFTGMSTLGRIVTCRVVPKTGEENSFYHWDMDGTVPTNKVDSIRIDRRANGQNNIVILMRP